MQPNEKKPLSKIWTFIVMLACFLLITIITIGIARSFKAWLIISFTTALMCILVPALGKLTKHRNIPFLYVSMLAPILVFVYTYFINLYLTEPFPYTVVYGGCFGSFIGTLLSNQDKVKISKYDTVGVFLFYILIGYITFRIS